MVRNTLMAALSILMAGVALAEDTSDGQAEAAIVDTQSFWRFRLVWETEEVALPSGEVGHYRFACDRNKAYSYFSANKAENELPASMYKVEKAPMVRIPADMEPDWMKPGFDDGAWIRLRGPLLDQSVEDTWKLIQMRGLFEVTDPAKAAGLKLSLTFRGGVVVYLNGEEVARAFMPAGPLGPHALAEPYPDDVYLTPEGRIFLRGERQPELQARVQQRVRKLEDFRLPADKLRKGVNVLAVSIHRTPINACYYLRRMANSVQCNPPHDAALWGKVSLLNVRLSAGPGAAVVPNRGPLRGRGFQVWNQSVLQTTAITDYPDPFAPLYPVELLGCRNGRFAGMVVVGHDEPIKGLRAEAGELAGPGTIPASAVTVRYALPDGETGGTNVPWFDSLDDSPPAEVPVGSHGKAVRPLWITVKVPADAKPGEYTGSVTVKADNAAEVKVPLRLRVLDWALPDSKDYTSRMDIAQSPESVAMAYDVPLWSDEHLRLLDRSFALLSELAAKTVYVTCIRRTHFGNEHALVRWVKGEDGELSPEFSVAEKYLDVATRHLGKIPGVILYAWEPFESEGHVSGTETPRRTFDKEALITVVDPSTGRQSARQGPAWGTPEAKVFWKKFNEGIRPVLAKRGLEDSSLFGLVGDSRPTKQAMDDMVEGSERKLWAVHSHYYCDNWKGYKMGMTVALWGVRCQLLDPASGHGYGWANPQWLEYFPRELSLQSTLSEYRAKIEAWAGSMDASKDRSLAKGTWGLGRLGADFWVVVKNAKGVPRAYLVGRYPESYWGQLNLTNGVPCLLGKGAKGPVPTVRSEAFRENLQEMEARIYLEKAMLDEQTRPLMGDDLVSRCRAALDERIRTSILGTFTRRANCPADLSGTQTFYISSGWGRRMGVLFGLAAETAARLGGKVPAPQVSGPASKTAEQSGA